jgi:hypothetical protein
MPSFRDLDEVAAFLANLDVPFTWYSMGAERDGIAFEVAPQDCETAVRYFSQHPVILEDQTPVFLSVRPRRGRSWMSPPHEGLDRADSAFDEGVLVGLDVAEAARLANAAGWLVRAHEAEAIITADFNPNRLNLLYGDDNAVVSVGRG